MPTCDPSFNPQHRGRHVVVALLSALLSVAACSEQSGNAEKDPPLSYGGLTVEVDADPPVVRLLRGDVVVAETTAPGAAASDGAPRGLAFRRAGAAVEMRYGAFKIVEEPHGPWFEAARFGAVEIVDKADPLGPKARWDVLDAGGTAIAEATLHGLAGGGVALSFRALDFGARPGSAAPINRASIGLRCAAGEHFLGLGGQSFDVDHRGQRVPLWVSEDGIGKYETDDLPFDWFLKGRRHSTHTPIPQFLSSAGYAAVVDTPTYALFDLCAADAGVARLEAWQGTLRLMLFAGGDPKATLQQQSEAIGRPKMPPVWAFAPWLDAMFGPENVLRVAKKLRQHGVPCAAIWSEDWRGGNQLGENYALEEDWKLDTALYPDADKLTAELRGLGFAWLTYNNTFLSKEGDVWAEAEAKGYTLNAPGADGKLAPYLFDGADFAKTGLLDLSNKDAIAWAKAIMRQSLEIGALGWMADFAEWMPTAVQLADGSDPMAFHNRYPVEYQRLNRELLDDYAAATGEDQALFFVRSAWLGSQPLVSVVWAGDQQTDFSRGDGMPSVIPMGVGLGVAGFPFFAHDIGGYMSTFTEPTTKELWFRWVTLGALSPVMRTHHGRAVFANWNWESSPDSISHFARWAAFHTRLLPTLLALAEEATTAGTPMLRPLALDWPDFAPGWSDTDTFALGPALIVAPVLEKGATSRSVTLPKGRFFRLIDSAAAPGAEVAGRAAAVQSDGAVPLSFAASITEIPVLVPAGAVLVLLPEGVQTPLPTAGAKDLSDVGSEREVWLYRGGDGSFAGAGLTLSWKGTALAPEALDAAALDALLDGAAFTEATGAAASLTRDGTSLLFAGDGTLTLPGGATLKLEGSGGATLRVRVW